MAKTQAQTIAAKKSAAATTPWACRRQKDGAAIDAYIEGLGEWATVATTVPVATLDPQAVAEQIIRAVNAYENDQELLNEMAAALELCLACDGISWEAEHDAEITLNRYRRREPAKTA